MTITFRPEGFDLFELVPPEIFALGEKGWDVFDLRILQTLDQLKKVLGYRMIVNTWNFKSRKYDNGNIFKYRGFRPKGCGVGAVTGAHYKGMAMDIDFYDMVTGVRISVKEIQRQIIKNKDKFPFIVGLELNVAWNHIDVMTEKDSPARGGVVPGKIFLFDVTNNAKSWFATKPEDYLKVA